jgi:hypothetical protein
VEECPSVDALRLLEATAVRAATRIWFAAMLSEETGLSSELHTKSAGRFERLHVQCRDGTAIESPGLS